MTDSSITITVLRSGFSSIPDISEPKFSTNRVAYRGEVITLSPEQIEATRDLNGNSWLDMTEEQQLDRWGHVNFRVGDVREEEAVKFIADDDEAMIYRLREQATKIADQISDPVARREARAEIAKRFGAPESSQRTLQAWER